MKLSDLKKLEVTPELLRTAVEQHLRALSLINDDDFVHQICSISSPPFILITKETSG